MVNKSRKRIRKKSRKLSRQRRYSRKKSRSMKRKSRSMKRKSRSMKRKSRSRFRIRKKKSRRRRSRGSSQRRCKFQMRGGRPRPPSTAAYNLYLKEYKGNPTARHRRTAPAAAKLYTYLTRSNSIAAKKKLIEKLKHIMRTYKPWVKDGKEPSFKDIYGRQGYPVSIAGSQYSIALLKKNRGEQVVDLLRHAEGFPLPVF